MSGVTVEAEEYPLAVRALDMAARGAELLNLGLGELDTANMMASASRSTGLDDFGDSAFEEPFRLLIDNARHAPLTALARIITRQSCIRSLKNRLQIEAYTKQHPSLQDVPVERPIFVLGFPRTGTTLLQNLLSQPHDRRALQFWELNAPCPVHPDPEIDRTTRIRTTDRMLRAAYLVAPEMGAVHEIRSTSAEECWPLFSNTFAVMNYDLQSGMGDYGRWLLSHDMRGPYREYLRQLQILLQRRPARHVVLKCPEHLWFLDALLEVFPDACIVWTHRDPLDSLASYCSLISIAWRMLFGHFQPRQIGTHITDRFLTGVTRAMDARERYKNDDRFIDVHFSSLVHDPGAVVRQIHEKFDLRHGPEVDGLVTTYLNGRRADKRGAHQYSAERYGLTPDEVYAAYAPYIDRFNVSLRHR